MGNNSCTFQDRTCFPWTDENHKKSRRRQEEKERGKEVDVNTWRYSWMRKNALANKLYSYCEHDHGKVSPLGHTSQLSPPTPTPPLLLIHSRSSSSNA